jgi:hypothetical protein
MYYEERIINGVLHFRSNPNRDWEEMTPLQLTSIIKDCRTELYKVHSLMARAIDSAIKIKEILEA